MQGRRCGSWTASADTVLAAADAALVASGTATLQTLLHGCPMVVAYRVAPLTALLARDFGLVKVRYISQPNLLAGEELVPEFLQEAVHAAGTGVGAAGGARGHERRDHLQARFRAIHLELRQGGAAQGRAGAYLNCSPRGRAANGSRASEGTGCRSR